MAMQATSDFSFVSLDGNSVPCAKEWESALVVLPVMVSEWDEARFFVQDEEIALSIRHVQQAPVVVADWVPRAAGQWRLRLECEGVSLNRTVLVEPTKLDLDAVQLMIDDLERILPASIVASFDRSNASSGSTETEPRHYRTIAEELNRISRALEGAGDYSGLFDALKSIGERPHQVLQRIERWQLVERARNVSTLRLAQTFQSRINHNALKQGIKGLERVWEIGHATSYDLFENRLVKHLVTQVGQRLRLILSHLHAAKGDKERLRERASELLHGLERHARSCQFLEFVSAIGDPPSRTSMVLQRRPDYQAVWRRWREFNQSRDFIVLLDKLEDPINNVPYLYEVWGTLFAIDRLLSVCNELGWGVVDQNGLKHHNGWLFEINWTGQPILRLRRGTDEVVVTPQRSFHQHGKQLRSISFRQVPDLVIERLDANGRPRVLILDPKYKLAYDDLRYSSDLDAADDRSTRWSGKPTKADIDKMHTYSDAIRTADNARIVEFAAILFPGHMSEFFGSSIAAIAAHPARSDVLALELDELFHRFLV